MTQQQPATFTPGPWHVDDYQAGGVCFILASDGMTVATATAEVNARLIAEAPAMFDLLQSGEPDLCSCSYCQEARALIQRVQGGD